jgi:hypothetical protein
MGAQLLVALPSIAYGGGIQGVEHRLTETACGIEIRLVATAREPLDLDGSLVPPVRVALWYFLGGSVRTMRTEDEVAVKPNT